ncbi:DUF2147 domain-containing protein [Lutimaribacter sp. EGI FJ00015]|uniref:DUF2147 domain-containing protein n=1 Tax=Lutimaribacter degradans TaxID=2945989 RepID=A0ACC5ZS98_9RHOB|nr:DUF2147 domain-containing protein [Lutimaribacter sp. EGI FJ00013]MCM2560661.1 DUF2147 domain-containing protein [Lutimaribacter sp. EGI FJ00013]MCO0612396.1 DUF2147 domain-containing protein [Lutimaribacter sp. EGI FJ00015]MCO0634485.1 DUF2147 domain-containing protein [Lutimaribacter sp. EGI FJ00014]
MTRKSAILALVLLTGGAAQAEPIVGTWLTGPDNKDQVAHMQITSCGASFCGKVLRAFGSEGQQVTTPNVGKRVIWDVTAQGSGTYRGKVLLPLYRTTVDGLFSVVGDRLKLKGCMGPVCRTQSWTRVH